MQTDMRSLRRAVPVLALLLLTVPAWAVFIDEGDGTVTDTETGLMWDKCSWSQSWTGMKTNICSGLPLGYHWAEALGMAVIANGVRYRGYADWRLPNKNELESLVDIRAATAPTIDAMVFSNTPGAIYWSSTSYAPDPDDAWYVNFLYGNTYAESKDNLNHVRLVRGGQSFGAYDLLEAAYRITKVPNPPDGGTVSCMPNPVPDGGSSHCTATPTTGYRFLNWSGDCLGTTCTLTNVTAPARVTAHFALASPVPALGPWSLSLLVGLLAAWGGIRSLRGVLGQRR